MIKLFNTLILDEKINFFLNVQKLLVQYHPDSHFIFRQDNIQTRKDVTVEFIKNYKGFVYQDENISILFNRDYIEDPSNILENFNVYKEPVENFNAMVIDFVVFRQISDIEVFCRFQYSPKTKWIVYVKNGKLKLFESEKLLVNLGIDFEQVP